MGTKRNLSVSEYFDAVQKEYLLAEFKKKIYHSIKDKQYYQKVMLYKIDKINTIAERNSLNSILNDKKTYTKLHNELFNQHGVPYFDLTESDLENYYSIDSEFSYDGEVWLLEKAHNYELFDLRSKTNGTLVTLEKSKIFRVL